LRVTSHCDNLLECCCVYVFTSRCDCCGMLQHSTAMACNSQGFWTPWWWLRLSGRNMLEWLKNNKLINPKLICAFCWFVLFFKILLHLEVTDRWSVGRITGPPEPSVWYIFTPAAFVSLSVLASSRNEYNNLFSMPDAPLQSWFNRRDHLLSSYISCIFPRITSLKRKCKSTLVGYR